MNYLDFSAFSPLYGELWAAGENFGRPASAAAAASCVRAVHELIDVAERRVRRPAQRQTWPVQILWGVFRSPGRFNSSAGTDGSRGEPGQGIHQGQVWGDWWTITSSSHILTLEGDIALAAQAQTCWINLMMYSVLGRKLGVEAQYLRVKRQMGHKRCVLSSLLVFFLFFCPPQPHGGSVNSTRE